jgi:hypothetical protein
MLENLTIETLLRIRDLARAEMAGDRAADPDERVWRDFGEPFKPRRPTPERLALRSFLQRLSHDELVEAQAAYILGRDPVRKSRVKYTLEDLLEYSRGNADHMASYLSGNDLARALTRTLELIEEIPGLVKNKLGERAGART